MQIQTIKVSVLVTGRGLFHDVSRTLIGERSAEDYVNDFIHSLIESKGVALADVAKWSVEVESHTVTEPEEE